MVLALLYTMNRRIARGNFGGPQKSALREKGISAAAAPYRSASSPSKSPSSTPVMRVGRTRLWSAAASPRTATAI